MNRSFAVVRLVGVRQADDLLRIAVFSSGWHDELVCQEVVHERAAQRSRVAEPTDHHWSGPRGQRPRLASLRIAHEVDDDVVLVCPEPRREL